MRKWRPPEVPAGDIWKNIFQIVVPRPYQEEILKIAHDSPRVGHLGVNKTHERILDHFDWPGLRVDVVRFCKTCHTCQMIGKLNQKIPVIPLKPIPAFEEPFRSAIHVAGLRTECCAVLQIKATGNE